MNVNGEKLSKDIIQPLQPLKSKERQKVTNFNQGWRIFIKRLKSLI